MLEVRGIKVVFGGDDDVPELVAIHCYQRTGNRAGVGKLRAGLANLPRERVKNYNGDYWADQAFPPSYRQSLVEVARQMADHFNERGWHDTLFQGFLSNKNNFKEQGWQRGSSLLAARRAGQFSGLLGLALVRPGVSRGGRCVPGPGKTSLPLRHFSPPQWQRDLLDDVLDYNVVGGAIRCCTDGWCSTANRRPGRC